MIVDRPVQGATALAFNGSTQYAKTSTAIGSDSKLCTGFISFRRATDVSGVERLLTLRQHNAPGAGFSMLLFLQRFTITAESAANSVVLTFGGSTDITDTTAYHTFLFSFDLTSTSKRWVLYDRVMEPDAGFTTYIDTTIDFTGTTNSGDSANAIAALGSNSITAFGQKFNGAIARMWLFTGVYIDLSLTNGLTGGCLRYLNMLKFIKQGRSYLRNLNDNGSSVTGSAPSLYHRDGNPGSPGAGPTFTLVGTPGTVTGPDA